MDLERFDVVAPELFSSDLAEAEQKRLFATYVRNITLEPFDHCNRTCPYCPVSFLDRRTGFRFLEQSHLDIILRDLGAIDYAGSVCLNLYNEPLAHDRTFEVVSAVRAAVPKANVWFSTNGDYVNRKSLERLVAAGLKRIVVTLHTTEQHPYDEKQQITRISQFSARTGVALTMEKFRPGIDMRLTGRYKGLKITVKSVNFMQHGVNRGDALKEMPVERERDAPCDRPFHDLTIAWNGNVYPCCQFVEGIAEHERFVVGNVGTAESLYALFCSKMMASFRKDVFGYGGKMAPCSTCADQDKCRGENDRRLRGALSKEFFGQLAHVERVAATECV